MSEQSAGLDAQLAKLRRGLADRWLRVSDVFSRWDDDNSGTISKSEWVKVVVSLIGADQTNKQEAAALFDALDKDRSGELDYKELYKELRAGGSIELDGAVRRAGRHAAGVHRELFAKVGVRPALLREDGLPLRAIGRQVVEQKLPSDGPQARGAFGLLWHTLSEDDRPKSIDRHHLLRKQPPEACHALRRSHRRWSKSGARRWSCRRL